MPKISRTYHGVWLIACFSLILSMTYKAQARSASQIVTLSGQTIASIFDGLKPSSYAHYKKEGRHSTRAIPQFLEERLGDEYLGARYVTTQGCGQCSPDTACAGHYEKLVDSSGCDDPYGACPLPLDNTETDTQNAAYSEGSYDSYCGLFCCVDEQICDNP